MSEGLVFDNNKILKKIVLPIINSQTANCQKRLKINFVNKIEGLTLGEFDPVNSGHNNISII